LYVITYQKNTNTMSSSKALINMNEENISNRTNEQISWQREEKKDFTDWKIILKCEDNKKRIEKFYVHKVCIAAGKNRSEYFERLFTTMGNFREHEAKRSDISLDEEMVDVFPSVLDFLYSEMKQIKVKQESYTKDAVTILALGKYFGINGLVGIVEDIIKRNCAIAHTSKGVCETLSIWFCKARNYAEDEIAEQILRSLARAYYASPNLRCVITKKMTNSEKMKLLELSFSHVTEAFENVKKRQKSSEAGLHRAEKRVRKIKKHYSDKNVRMPNWMKDILQGS